jgi:flavin-dependent dehydrogenase
MSQNEALAMGIPSQVIIVGGGTAGWMAASLLQQAWSQNSDTSTQITVLESEDIGTIGGCQNVAPPINAVSLFRDGSMVMGVRLMAIFIHFSHHSI